MRSLEVEGESAGSSRECILIAASGSGGHLMPARYIADALADRGYEIHFVGSGRRLEEDIFGSTPYTAHSISLTGLNNVGIKGWVRFFLKLPGAFLKTRALVSNLQPRAVIGVGGYASVLPVLIASSKGIPSWIHEAELSPGNANRFLARFASKVSIAFEETSDFPAHKKVFTGHPLRRDVAELDTSYMSPNRVENLLVIGGSQGAKALDEALEHLAPRLQSSGFRIFHQCRPEHVERLRARYEEVGLEARVESFIQELGEAYRWSHLIVCRAGAGTVMEIATVNKPTIFVPFPYAQGLHQHKNAETLASKGKALIVEEGETFEERLFAALAHLQDPDAYQEMVDRPKPHRPIDAAERIADGVEAIMRKGKPVHRPIQEE